MTPRAAWTLGWLSLLGANVAHAGASLYVDDAGITPAGQCQMESWARAYAPGAELSAVPACTQQGVEYSLGVSRFDRPYESLLSPGIKHMLRDPEEHAWGAAISVGAIWNGTYDRLDGWNATVPVTLALDPQRNTLLHADLGWSKLRGARGAVAGGVGLERKLTGRWRLLAEVYADGNGNAVRQLGARRAFGQAASLDLLLGRATGNRPGHWLTLGLNVALPD